MPRFRQGAGIVALLMTLAACPSSTAPDLSTNQEELDRQKRAWATAGIDDYQMLVRLQGAWFWGSAKIAVRDGVAVSITPVEPGNIGPDGQPLQHYDTAEKMFGVVERAIQQGADRLKVQYHPTLGIPVDVYVDYSNSIDEEHGFVIEDFRTGS